MLDGRVDNDAPVTLRTESSEKWRENTGEAKQNRETGQSTDVCGQLCDGISIDEPGKWAQSKDTQRANTLTKYPRELMLHLRLGHPSPVQFCGWIKSMRALQLVSAVSTSHVSPVASVMYCAIDVSTPSCALMATKRHKSSKMFFILFHKRK